jgi:ectoine hydroxylase-related dioxygenase (phytanoyl-CoA dioxygenase family)
MATGSCLFYTGKVYHGGGANRSEHTRVGLNITYVVGWLRQEENQYLSVPQEVAMTLPDELLRLMGYRMGAYAGLHRRRPRPDRGAGGRSGSMSFGDLAVR